MADRQAVRIEKSRRRDPSAYDFDRWWIVDPYNNSIVAGVGHNGRQSLTLDEVEAWLTGDRS